MELLVVGSILLCAAVGALVGLKLLGIAAHTRKLPELAIGTGLLAYSTLSQPVLLAQQALGEETSVGLGMGLVVLRVVATYVTLVGLSLFTWQVFGAESRWRQALAAAMVVAGLISGGMTIWAAWLNLTANLPMPLYGRLGMLPHFTLSFGWVSLESLRYYALMRKRRALGLADPVVTNRFLVWGAGEGVASLVVFTLFAAMLRSGEILASDPLVSWCVTLAALVNALVWWLTFTPPRAYLRWIRDAAAEGAIDG
jgi:hypothetical protein